MLLLLAASDEATCNYALLLQLLLLAVPAAPRMIRKHLLIHLAACFCNLLPTARASSLI